MYFAAEIIVIVLKHQVAADNELSLSPNRHTTRSNRQICGTSGFTRFHPMQMI